MTGRIKEIIDRGGEKVAPGEIEDVLISHPGVQQVVVFPVPHPALGEDIAAAVVPKNGKSLSEFELRDFALQHLPGFKVPTRILILAQIPTGSTGKVQRAGLADRLAPEFAVTYERPAKGLEQLSAVVFESVLQLDRVGRNDNFFALGGDSIGAMQVVARLVKVLDIEIPPVILSALWRNLFLS